MSRGPVIADLEGLTLTNQDIKLLNHPSLGGVVLFSRNFQDLEQLHSLVSSIRAIRPECLICVDQEGGRVQRFIKGFTRLPSLRTLGIRYDKHHDLPEIKTLAEQLGYLMATEVRAAGVDLSFAPVLDLDWGVSEIIGNRAFHSNNEIVAAIAKSYVDGMHAAMMPATGKHFPGHGAVALDSHTDLPIDKRELADIQLDMLPFKELIEHGLDAIMPAHIVYPSIDSLPAGFSKKWLQEILRKELGFKGIIFSDDLSMTGASSVGDYAERAHLAIEAGCDFILVCNNSTGAFEILNNLAIDEIQKEEEKRNAFCPLQPEIQWESLFNTPQHLELQDTINSNLTLP